MAGKILKHLGFRLSGSPYCDDNGQREQTIIDFEGVTFDDEEILTLVKNIVDETVSFELEDTMLHLG